LQGIAGKLAILRDICAWECVFFGICGRKGGEILSHIVFLGAFFRERGCKLRIFDQDSATGSEGGCGGEEG